MTIPLPLGQEQRELRPLPSFLRLNGTPVSHFFVPPLSDARKTQGSNFYISGKLLFPFTQILQFLYFSVFVRNTPSPLLKGFLVRESGSFPIKPFPSKRPLFREAVKDKLPSPFPGLFTGKSPSATNCLVPPPPPKCPGGVW